MYGFSGEAAAGGLDHSNVRRVAALAVAALLGLGLVMCPLSIGSAEAAPSASQTFAASTAPKRSFGTGEGFCKSATPVGSNSAPLSSGASFKNVYPCGPIPSRTPETYGVPSSSAETASYRNYANYFEYPGSDAGFQCVELANRVLWVADGISPVSSSSVNGYNLTGYNYVDTEIDEGQIPSSERFYNTTASATNNPYLPGDVVSFSGDGGAGHVAVVMSSTYEVGDGGTYQVTLMEENASKTGKTTAPVTNWVMGEPAGEDVSPYDYIAFPQPNWQTQTAPNPSRGENAQLTGVSCVSTAFCEAVGYFNQSDSGGYLLLAELWNGTEWAIQSAPDPAGSGANLNAVSCASSIDCEAVGSYYNGAGHPVTLAEKWNGNNWTIQKAPTPDGSDVNLNLYGVSCIDTGTCEAVGRYINDADRSVTLAEKWNGADWTIQKTSNPGADSGASGVQLLGVSCTSTTACEAVGSYQPLGGGDAFPLAEGWNGSKWSIQKTPEPNGSGWSLNGVSCISAKDCEAAGSGFASGLLETWNGTKWTIQLAPTADVNSDLDGVSCTSPTFCEAVGAQDFDTPWAEGWDGSHWTEQAPPSPSGSQGASPEAVSCMGTACEAVGAYGISSGVEVPLVEQYTSF